METAQANPSPTPDPSLADILRTPDLLHSVDIDKLLGSLPIRLPAEISTLAEQATLKILFDSQGVRVEQFIAACFDWQVWATKLEERSAPDLADHAFAEEQSVAAQSLQARFPEFQFNLTALPQGQKFEELNQTNHALCYALGKLLAGVLARDPSAWGYLLEWVKRAEKVDFVSMESPEGKPEMTLSLAAMQPLFVGLCQELPQQLKSLPANAPKFVDGLTELAKLYSPNAERSNPIGRDARYALSEIAVLDPSLFDTEMSSLLNAPRRKQLLDGTETPERRVELMQTFVQSRFGLPIGVFKWEEMPLSRGAVVGAIEELYRGMKSELRRMLTAEGKDGGDADFTFSPQTAFGALYEMFERQELLDSIHRFRAIGMPSADIIKEVLPTLENENALIGNERYQNAVVLEDDGEALEQFEALGLDELHIIDREFLEPLLSTLLERGEKPSDPELLTQLETHAKLAGEFSETALRLLRLGNPERAMRIDSEALRKAAALPKPFALPDLLDRCANLLRIQKSDAPCALLEACLPVAARLDHRYVEHDPSNYLVAVGPGMQRPELWAARLRLDEPEGLRKLLRAAIIGSIAVDDDVRSEEDRIEPAKRMLTQEIAIRTVEHVAKLLPEAELRTLFRAAWGRLSDARRDSFIGALTNSKFEMAWHPSVASRAILAELASEAVTPEIAARLHGIRAFHSSWTVKQYYH